ncbi:glycosyltransferase family 4 protein [Streptomyces aureus]|uniref:glycosyltransferase family 4 protein n=1 Tax=Streptomyces aureus TaxID=193461 RepID=UPI003684B517
MKISFLLHNAYGIGGTISTTFNLARALTARHEVEIVSVLRHREHPTLSLDPGVALGSLVDLRQEEEHPSHRIPARVFPRAEYRYRQYSELTDRRIGDHLAATDADVVVGTRPGLNVQLALQAPRHLARVGQEHLTLDGHPPRLRSALRRAYRRLDTLTTVTEADAGAYRRTMPLPGVRVEALPNSVPESLIPPADGSAKVIVAAGRLVPVKRYDLLIEAFAQVAAEHPDWKLRIYGKGDEHDRLRRLVADLGLYDSVLLMGTATPMEAEWVKGSIAVTASDYEAFGMTIIEAMSCGLPVVSTDCPHGPGEIIQDGVDGRLVPAGDRDALGAALRELVRDEEWRLRAGRAARANAQRYAPGPVVTRAERLFAEAVSARKAGRPVLRERTGVRRALAGRGFALRDAAHGASDRVLRTLRGRA